ncbi:hypothetical protein [Maritalea sp.]|jgi:hypothetical protein|uniref:hypothetical protein n=1 Tax=Maritalea sp. TaxID=2003361 RepID=UPI0039E28867
MALRMTATNVHEISEGLWSFEMPPHQVRHFGGAQSSVGARSVMIFTKHRYDPKARELHFDADGVSAINIGTDPVVIGLDVNLDKVKDKSGKSAQSDENERSLGHGDKEFLRMAEKEMSIPMQRASIALLNGVRARSPGDLKKGKSRNFSDTPDNFWYVIFQPRIDQLSITVRGSVDHFEPVAKLPIKDDRGNTLFKVTSEEDVPAALQIIFHAKRKNR